MSHQVWTEESATAAVARALDTLSEVVALRAENARLRRKNVVLRARLKLATRVLRRVVRVAEHGR